MPAAKLPHCILQRPRGNEANLTSPFSSFVKTFIYLITYKCGTGIQGNLRRLRSFNSAPKAHCWVIKQLRLTHHIHMINVFLKTWDLYYREPVGTSLLLLSFWSLFLLWITLLSGSIEFSHRGINQSQCGMIFKSHIHNLWIYYGGGLGKVRGVNPPSAQSAVTSKAVPVFWSTYAPREKNLLISFNWKSQSAVEPCSNVSTP